MRKISEVRYLLPIVLLFGISIGCGRTVGATIVEENTNDSAENAILSNRPEDTKMSGITNDGSLEPKNVQSSTKNSDISVPGKGQNTASSSETNASVESNQTKESSGLVEQQADKKVADQATVNVDTYEEFKAALLDSNVQTISLENDIKILDSFNFIGNKKISGNGHTLDVNYQSVGVALSNAVCTIEEIHLINQPIYSFFWSEYPGVTVNYKNVTSSGYQFIYLAAGTANLEGNIEASANLQEIFQGQKLNVGDHSNVTFKDTANAIAIYSGDGLTVGDGANFTVDAQGLGMFMYNVNGKIDLHGNVEINSATDSAIRGGANNGSLIIYNDAKLKATSKVTDEEAILLYNGSVIVKSNGTLVATSEGLQSTLQTGNKLELQEGSNFMIANSKGNALGAWELKTKVSLSSSQGISTWKIGNIGTEMPDAIYQGPLSASFTLDTYTTGQHTLDLASNNSTFKADFDSGKVAKIAGGIYSKKTEIAPTTIDKLTTESTQVSGTAEPEAILEIKADGKVIASGTVNKNGEYKLAIPNQKEGTKVVAVARSGGLSAEASTIVQAVGPRIELPDVINFKSQEIPPQDTLIKFVGDQEINVFDDSKKKSTTWTLSVREDQPLKNESGELLVNRLEIYNQGKLFQITDENQPLFEGKGQFSVKLADCMRLALHPADKIGSYKGALMWTFIKGPQ